MRKKREKGLGNVISEFAVSLETKRLVEKKKSENDNAKLNGANTFFIFVLRSTRDTFAKIQK